MQIMRQKVKSQGDNGLDNAGWEETPGFSSYSQNS